LATASLGLPDPSCLNECAITPRANDLVDALTKRPWWLDKAIELLAHRADDQRLGQLPRIGKPTAAALLTAMGDMHAYQNGKHLGTLAGLDLRLFASGSSSRKLPQIAHVGSAYLRYWLYHSAMRLIAHAPQFTAYAQRRKPPSPGQGAGQRALRAVCDKAIHML
jgi:hypothetical protein